MFSPPDTTELANPQPMCCQAARLIVQQITISRLWQTTTGRRGSIPFLVFAYLAVILVLGYGADAAKNHLRSSLIHQSQVEREPLYLPKSRYVKLVSLGFNAMVADVLWFDTLNYFGKQFSRGRDYRWLSSMCELVTTLNPEPLHTYEFCGTLLAWIAKEPKLSNSILNKAITHHPGYWRFHYLRGFNYYYFLGDKTRAAKDFVVGSKLDGAPLILSSLASRLMVEDDSPDVAVMFLASMYKRASNRSVRAALEDKLKRAILARDLQALDKTVAQFQTEFGRLPESLEELVVHKLLGNIPREPFGGQYILIQDPLTLHSGTGGFVTSSSGEKPLEFKGKTARTGMLQEQFSSHGRENISTSPEPITPIN